MAEPKEPGKKDENVLSFQEEKEKLRNKILAGDDDLEALIFDDDIYLQEMNEKHAFINSVGGKPMILCHVYSAVAQRKIIEFRSPDAIVTQYSNQSIKQDKGFVDLGRWWIRHASRREYDTVVFDPSSPREIYGCLNLWEGLPTEPKAGSWKRTCKHIYKILCNGDPIKFKYTVKWFAWMLQNPGDRAEVSIIFKGKEGAGKGFIFSQFLKIFGQYAINISNRKHLTGQFNGHLTQCVFLFADEAYYPGDKEVEGTLKQLITEENIPIENKFKTLGPSKNCLHIGMSTNQDWVIPAGEDSRRYFINEVDSSFAKNQEHEHIRDAYFDLLWGEMDKGGREAMVYDMLKIDLTGWHPRFNVPITSEMLRQRHLSVPKALRFYLSFLEEGIFPGEYTARETYECSSEQLIDYFDKIEPYCKKISMRAKIDIVKKFGGLRHRKPNKNFWVFPPLHEARKLWEEICGSHDWGSEEENIEWRMETSAY